MPYPSAWLAMMKTRLSADAAVAAESRQAAKSADMVRIVHHQMKNRSNHMSEKLRNA